MVHEKIFGILYHQDRFVRKENEDVNEGKTGAFMKWFCQESPRAVTGPTRPADDESDLIFFSFIVGWWSVKIYLLICCSRGVSDTNRV